MNYYIADTHFGHDNIRRLSNRPFETIEEMDKTIIDNWNSRVNDNDDIYILGDFSYKSEDPILYLKQLIGRKHLIVGNHDGKLLKNPVCKNYFIEICDIKMVNDNGTQIVCVIILWLNGMGIIEMYCIFMVIFITILAMRQINISQKLKMLIM